MKRLAALLLLLALAGAPSTARADPQVVLRAPDGVTLTANDLPEGALCLRLVGADEFGAELGEECRQADEERGLTLVADYGVDPDARTRGPLLAGVVPADVATVELRLRGAPRVRIATEPGAYTGPRRDRVRFFLTRGPRGASAPSIARLLAADGRSIEATQVGELTLAAADVQRYRGPRVRGVLRATLRLRLAPTPRERDRVVREVCLVGAIRIARSTSRQEICAATEPALRDLVMPLSLADDADPDAERVGVVDRFTGLTTPGIARIVATLGSGGRLTARVDRLPARFGPAAGGTFLLEIPRREAVRRIDVVGTDGRVVATPVRALAPATTVTRDGPDRLAVLAPILPGPARLGLPAPADDAAAALLVRTQGEVTCVELPEGPFTCDRIPDEPQRPVLVGGLLSPSRRLVAGIVHPDVSRVQPSEQVRIDTPKRDVFRIGDRPIGDAVATTELPAGSIPGLPGARGFVLRGPRGNASFDVSLYDAAGARLGGGAVPFARDDVLDASRPPRTRIARIPGGGRLRLAGDGRSTCVELRYGARAELEGCASPVLLLSGCRPRAAVVVLAPALRGARVVLADRTVRRARTVRVGAEVLRVVVLRPGDRPRSVRATEKGRRVILRLGAVPASAAQCGFRLER